MKKLTVAYNVKNWSEDGSHYNQRIKVDRSIVEEFNKYVESYRVKHLSGVDGEMNERLYLKPIELNDKVFLRLTQTRHLRMLLRKLGYNVDRILTNRNTYLKLVESI